MDPNKDRIWGGFVNISFPNFIFVACFTGDDYSAVFDSVINCAGIVNKQF